MVTNNESITTYAQAIPALAPLESGHQDFPAAAIEMGNPILSNHMTAASDQYQCREFLRSRDTQLVTDEELVEAKRRLHAVESAQFDGGTPLWAQQMQTQLQSQMTQMQTQTNQMQTQLQSQMNQMQTQMTQMQTQMQIESQRSRNYARHTTHSAIAALVRVADRNTPQDENLWFPSNQNELSHATGVQVSALLEFYGLPSTGAISMKRERLTEHLGVVL